MTIQCDGRKFSCCAILLAAGKSKRFKYATKKQFVKIKGKTLIEYVLDKFLRLEYVKQFIVVVARSDVEKVKHLISSAGKYDGLNISVIEGGKERYNSVYNAVKQISDDCDYVLVHDVARPFINKELIDRCIEEIIKYDCVIPAIQVCDTVKMINHKSEVIKTINRDNLVLVQTPQVFKTRIIKKIYSKKYLTKYTKKFNITDDAQLAELCGVVVKVVLGDKQNVKITTVEDLKFLKIYV
ncbi:MAG: 2-C-methyl-D-erythritol 4-phosphate cytidylyltransferase [Endomicrobia bacterium]|nr:2-C-methyl-D-erythritol 4-phosphate cytidylyltransferase [Endomicrobiia bacterium]